jgi:hypothetical protein
LTVAVAVAIVVVDEGAVVVLTRTSFEIRMSEKAFTSNEKKIISHFVFEER